MPDPTAIDQLRHQLLDIMGTPHPTNLMQVGQCLAAFWTADAWWLWPKVGQAVGGGAGLSETELRLHRPTATALGTVEVAGYQVMWIAIEAGQLALAKSGNWTTGDQGILQEIADLLVISFHQAELQRQVEVSKQSMRQVQALADERTAQLQSSQNLLAKLQEANRRRIKQLDDNNRLKDEFISTISHELRTPLTSMSLAIRMLHQPNLDVARRSKYLEILEQQCTQEINLINDLLALQQLESKQMSSDRQIVDLPGLLQPLVHKFQEDWTNKQLQLQVDLPPACSWQTEPESISRIVQELLTNAGKFSQPQTTVKLQVIADQNLVLRVINHGQLISTEEQTYIFRKFRRGQGITQQAIGGTGLGLALVKSLVQHLQGEIAVSSLLLAEQPTAQHLAVTCFEVLLPPGEP